MTYLISGLLIITNFITALLKGKGNTPKMLLLTFMWVLFWGNYDNADYSNYKLLYDYISYTGEGFAVSQFGFVQIMKLATKFGLQYHHFLIIVSFIGIYLITTTVKKYTNKPNLVYVLYFIHPFLLDIVQVKHFLAMAIIIYCLNFLEKDGKNNNIKYIIGILVASSIHLISLFFLPLLLVKKMKIRRLVLMVALVLVVGIPLAYSNFFEIVAVKIVGMQRIESYFMNRARFGFIIQFFIQGVICFLIHYCRLVITRHKENNRFLEVIYRTNLYLLILFPLYIINGTFERAFRIIMIPNYIVFTNAFLLLKKKEKVLTLTLLIIFVSGLFVHYVFIPSRDYVFFPIFNNNYIFK